MKHCSALKNEILSFTTTWMDLENIMLSEINSVTKDCKYTHLYDVFKIFKLIESEDRIVVSRQWGRREIGSCLLGIKLELDKMSKF